MNKPDFKGKIIVVTGAGQGIGNDVCQQLYKCGATVYAFSRSAGPLVALKAVCPNIHMITIDLTQWQQTKDALRILDGKKVHGLVNNAGIAIIKPFLDLTESDFDETFNVNFKALFNVTQQVVPHMVAGSCIVNVSSLASMVGIHGHSVYSATKAAVDSLTKSLALELGGDARGIRVNSVNPTVVLTQMGRANWSDPAKSGPLLDAIPLHRFAEVDDVVGPILFLLSESSAFVNGHCLPIEGGYLAC